MDINSLVGKTVESIVYNWVDYGGMITITFTSGEVLEIEEKSQTGMLSVFLNNEKLEGVL